MARAVARRRASCGRNVCYALGHAPPRCQTHAAITLRKGQVGLRGASEYSSGSSLLVLRLVLTSQLPKVPVCSTTLNSTSTAPTLPMRHIQAHSQTEASGVKHQVRPLRQASTETGQSPNRPTE